MRRLGAIVGVIAVASCNYDWTYRPDAGASTTKDAAGGSGDPAADASTPAGCSIDDPTCPSGQFCWFSDRACGAKIGAGECRVPTNDCADTQVCGCTGTLLSGCELWKSKSTDYDETGARCGATQGSFKCGLGDCITSKQVCVTQAGTSKCVDCAAGCKCPGFETCACNDGVPGEVRIDCK